VLIVIGRELGEVCRLLPMLIGTYTLSQVFLPPKNTLIKTALFASIAGVVLGGVTSGFFKILFHRYRPNAYGNPYMWTGPGVTTVNHLEFSKLDLSFPAGHTTVTSAVSTCWYAFIVSSQQLCTSPFTNIFLFLSLYIHPFLVLLSRVSECYHWTSDATFGVSFIIIVVIAKARYGVVPLATGPLHKIGGVVGEADQCHGTQV
jgi:membrane-associated phospholipid phosphatase